ncbi:MAG: hypothetical protein V8S37_06965 [Lachnospiraceae bacterium]
MTFTALMAVGLIMIRMAFSPSWGDWRIHRIRMGRKLEIHRGKPHFQLPDWGSSSSGIRKKRHRKNMKTWKEEEKVVEGWQKDVNSWWYQNFSNLLIYRGKMFFF